MLVPTAAGHLAKLKANPAPLVFAVPASLKSSPLAVSSPVSD
jgi:hypothetical protein